MILEGNERGGARNLALHLLKDENEHVTVHDMRGFIADDLEPALNEIYAVSRGTKAQKFMFSLSLNPPKEAHVSTEDFESAITKAEKELGFENQPRAIVLHEKNDRRHCHVVWSRIDAEEMKAIPLPYYKNRLMDISRDLYLEHGWKMPKGMMNSAESDPKNFTLAQWQQAKRSGKDARKVKTVFQDCWATSDGITAFKHALKERGYQLAKGNRGFVALDHKCEVYSVARQLPKGINTKQVIAKLGEPDSLPSADEAKTQIARMMEQQLKTLSKEQQSVIEGRLKEIEQKHMVLVKTQKQERQQLGHVQQQRQLRETQERQARFNKGLHGLLDRFTGKHMTIKSQNEQETIEANKRDGSEKDTLVFTQMEHRRTLQSRTKRLNEFAKDKSQTLGRDVAQYREVMEQKRDKVEFKKSRVQKQSRDGPERSF